MSVYYQNDWFTLYHGNSKEVLTNIPDESINCVVTSPPYWGLRDYKVEGQIGLEKTPEEYIQNIVDIFGRIKKVLRTDGVVWLNLGDSYAGGGRGNYGNGLSLEQGPKHTKGNDFKNHGCKQKDLVGIPWRTALALQADGWYLRQDIIWHKPNPMPESVKDRCTKSHEYMFLLTKSPKYFYDHEAIKEPSVCVNKTIKLGEKSFSKGQAAGKGVTPTGNGLNDTYTVKNKRNKRSVWTIPTKPFKEAHFAVFPSDLIIPCIKAGCPEGGIVLDPFIGAGTTALVANQLGRKCCGIELSEEYCNLILRRLELNCTQVQS